MVHRLVTVMESENENKNQIQFRVCYVGLAASVLSGRSSGVWLGGYWLYLHLVENTIRIDGLGENYLFLFVDERVENEDKNHDI